jgi:hypothetical protein
VARRQLPARTEGKLIVDNADGSNKLHNDSLKGIIAGLLTTFGLGGLVEMVGTLDFSTVSTFLSTGGVIAAGYLVNAFFAWKLKRDAARRGAVA